MGTFKLNHWYINTDHTCYVNVLEELGPDGKALCIFVQTSNSHISVYRSRRDAILLKQSNYSLCDIDVVDESLGLLQKLFVDYHTGEHNSFPFKGSKRFKGVLKMFGK